MIIAPHQQEFAETAREREGLWWGTGCAKTRAALYALKDFDGSILVVAPKTTVQKKQWEYEAGILGMKPPRVISKDEFRRDHKIIERYKAFVGEESHTLCGVMPNTRQRNKIRIPKASQIYEAVEWYINKHSPERVILVTATPNKTPMSVWAAATLLGHKIDFYEFRDEFYIRLPMDHIVYAPKRTKEAMESLAKVTRSIGQVLRLNDIKDVPEQTFITKSFSLTKAQQDALKTLPGRFTDAGALRLKRHQVENGILYEDIFDPVDKTVKRVTERFSCEKLEYILERADEFQKMVIFANYTEQIDVIAEALKKEGKNVHVLDSRTPDRKAVEKSSEQAESAYIIAQASISSEWEFKSCPVVIFASLSNKSIDYIQGQGRVQRYDKIKKNLYIHMIADYPGSVDKRWFECIMSGRDFNESLYI